MKNKSVWLVLIFLIVAAMLLASCNSSTTTSTQISTTSSIITTSTTPISTVVTTTSTAIQSTVTAATTTSTGNWWDSLGVPQYGGSITTAMNTDITNFDPYNSRTLVNINSGWMEKLFADDWTLNPSVFSYQMQYIPSNYNTGCLAESWTFTNTSTCVVQVRQGVYWQNIAPANGRELTAADIAYHYNRVYGLGGYGFTTPSPFMPHSWTYLHSVTATGKFEVTLSWNITNVEEEYELMAATASAESCIECPDAVAAYGNLNNWHNAIGTGPFILTDFVDASSASMVSNPNYWGHDERYPQNQLPYVQKLNILIIPNNATSLAAVRTGKIDVLDGILQQDAVNMQKSNKSISQVAVPAAYGMSINPKNNATPTSDIRVREAMQMAINLPEISQSYYGGTTQPYPVSLTSYYMTGWGFPYDQWPQDLKDQYAYNPTQAKQLLSAAGYPNGFNTNLLFDSAGDTSLLQIIQSYEAAIGINIAVQVVDMATFNTQANVLHQQPTLAMYSVGGYLGYTYEPITQLNRFMSTTASNYIGVNDPTYDQFFPNALNNANTTAQVQAIVSQTNKYVAQQHYVISLLQPMTFSLVQPWLKGYNGEYGAFSGNWGPTKLYTYPARCWIDQSLKK